MIFDDEDLVKLTLTQRLPARPGLWGKRLNVGSQPYELATQLVTLSIPTSERMKSTRGE